MLIAYLVALVGVYVQVLEEFQQDKLRLAYTHDRMTFLFADICGFTSWAKNVDACEVSRRQ